MTQQDTLTLWIGTGTDAGVAGRERSRGIYRAELDTRTGRLTLTGLAAELAHPTFLARAAGGTRLYAVSEVGEFEGRRAGAVAAFSVDPASSCCAPVLME